MRHIVKEIKPVTPEEHNLFQTILAASISALTAQDVTNESTVELEDEEREFAGAIRKKFLWVAKQENFSINIKYNRAGNLFQLTLPPKARAKNDSQIEDETSEES